VNETDLLFMDNYDSKAVRRDFEVDRQAAKLLQRIFKRANERIAVVQVRKGITQRAVCRRTVHHIHHIWSLILRQAREMGQGSAISRQGLALPNWNVDLCQVLTQARITKINLGLGASN
jgi:hypothetical protein